MINYRNKVTGVDKCKSTTVNYVILFLLIQFKMLYIYYLYNIKLSQFPYYPIFLLEIIVFSMYFTQRKLILFM